MLTKRQKHLGFSVSDSLDARVSNFMMNALKMPKKRYIFKIKSTKQIQENAKNACRNRLRYLRAIY